MSAETDLLLTLPGLPNIGTGGQWLGWSDDDMRAYARAERQAWFDQARKQADLCRAAEARAERLAGALLELCNVIDGHEVHVAIEGKAANARAALHPTAAQENGRE